MSIEDPRNWLTRQGNHQNGPYHLYGGLRSRRRHGWHDGQQAACGVAIAFTVQTVEAFTYPNGGATVPASRLEFDPDDERSCPRCLRVYRQQTAAPE